MKDLKMIHDLKPRNFLLFIIILQGIVYFVIFFDIPVARQIIGFFYFTVIPGLTIIKLLRLDMRLEFLEIVLLSVGLSMSSIMLLGLAINELGHLCGISQPLSTVPMLIILNSLILISVFFAYLKNKEVKFCIIHSASINRFALLFITLPILSVIGAIWAKMYDNNFILLVMIMATSSLFIIGIMFKRLLNPKFYPFAIFLIAIALLYHSSFISNYLVHFGSDLMGEYFVFKNTKIEGFWNSYISIMDNSKTNIGRINTMLSVTLLPTLFSNLLNIDPTWVFKILFPFIFSFVPVGLYQFWHRRFGSSFAFVSGFLLIAQEAFYTEMNGLNRQMIAEVFYVLLLITIFNEKMNPPSKKICFILFSFALIVSHYGLAEIALFLIAFTVLINLIILKRQSRNITIIMTFFFFILMFSWYIFTANATVFEDILEFGDYVYRQLGDFFNPASRGETVLRGLGLEAPPSFWNMVSRVFAYITEVFIAVGFLALVTRRNKIKLEHDYKILTLLSMALLAALIIVPGLANTMNMTRFYHILLFFLAPLFAIGAETIVSVTAKNNISFKVLILILVVLIPYFLFQTSFMYEVTGSDSWSVPLSRHRMPIVRLHGFFGYTDAFSVYSAAWLSNKINVNYMQVYTDYYSRVTELRGYSMIDVTYINILSNTTTVASKGIVYLSSLSINEGLVVGTRYWWNLSDLFFLNDLDKVYSNGGSEIYINGS